MNPNPLPIYLCHTSHERNQNLERVSMQNRTSIGPLRILLISVLALLLGALGGGVVAAHMGTTKIVTRVVSGPSSSPAAHTNAPAAAPLSWVDVAHRAGPAVVTIINHQQPQ